MNRVRNVYRRAGWLASLALIAACGCQTVRTPEEKIANTNIPKELQKVSMPDYVLEAPDLLLVEVLEALPGRPISGERLIRPDGKITLGFYGEVYVAGLTLTEAKEKIVLHLRKYLTDQALGLVDIDPETGEPKLDKSGKPILIEPKDSITVFIDVTAYNSKYYYVLGDVLITGRLSITGNETVLDALQFAGGLTPTAAPQNIRLVRPAPPGACCEQVLPVNLAAITSGGDPSTNYQMMPGDRLIVYRDPIVRFTIFLDRLVAPVQSVLSTTLQTAFTIRSVKFAGQPAGLGGAAGAARGPVTGLPLEPGAR
jgi:polysaccharide export outer membrane protein